MWQQRQSLLDLNNIGLPITNLPTYPVVDAFIITQKALYGFVHNHSKHNYTGSQWGFELLNTLNKYTHTQTSRAWCSPRKWDMKGFHGTLMGVMLVKWLEKRDVCLIATDDDWKDAVKRNVS